MKSLQYLAVGDLIDDYVSIETLIHVESRIGSLEEYGTYHVTTTPRAEQVFLTRITETIIDELEDNWPRSPS